MDALDPGMRAGAAPSGRLSIAFGAERLALVPFRAPAATVLAALALAVLAMLGIQMIRIDNSLSQLFRSEDPAFKQFEQVSREFPSSEYDVLIVVTGNSLLDRQSVEQLRSLVTDVQLIDGARGILSMFSARQPSPNGGMPEPLFPEPLPQGEDYRQLVDRALGNEIIRGRLLSDDGRLAVAILSLEPSAVDGGQLETIVNDIRRTMDDDLQGAGLTAELTGVPVMQLEIRHALERDRILYNAVGFALGCLIAALFLRRLSLMIVAAGPPLLAIVFALGALGWLGFRLNMFLNVMTPLIMVISFSDSMQLTFAARDQLMAGRDKRTAFRNAILIVGPACVLTHAAAGLSMLGLLSSSSDLIRGFGEAGFLATAIALVTVLSLVPAFGALLIRDETRFVATLKTADPGVMALRRFCAFIAGRMVGHPAAFRSGRACRRRVSRRRLLRPATELPARRPGSRPGAGRGGQRPTGRGVQRLESRRSADHIPSGVGPLCAADVGDDHRRPQSPGEPARSRQRVVARIAAALAGRADGADRRERAPPIRR